ncbi:MAG: hypothetical protein ACMVO3_14715 [Thalassobaculum sp.]
MSDEKRLSDIDRRGLKILARSSKTTTAGGRLSERLERAAETGLQLDYEKAERTFDSLPAEDRARIGQKAEKQAETERSLEAGRKRRSQAETVVSPTGSPLKSPPSRKRSGDDTLEWTPIFAPTASAPAPAPTGPAEKPQPQTRRPKSPKTSPAERRPAAKPTLTVAEDWERDDEDEHKDWNWRDIPDDPILNGGRKKTGPADPIEELRREMLGLDAKYGKR